MSGVAGLVANALLVAFFVLAQPYGMPDDRFWWLGTANDTVVMVQFLTLAPVVLALRRRLPASPSMLISSGIGMLALIVCALLQLLLITGRLTFEVQVVAFAVALLGVWLWLLVVSSVGHRSGSLPRSVTRFGLLLGVTLPIGALLTVSGLLIGWASGAPYRFALPGVVIGALGWLALPFWPLLLARRVLPREPVSTSAAGPGVLGDSTARRV